MFKWTLVNEIHLSNFTTYSLGAYYCRKTEEKGDSCILIKNYNFKERTEFYIYNEQDIFEICSIFYKNSCNCNL